MICPAVVVRTFARSVNLISQRMSQRIQFWLASLEFMLALSRASQQTAIMTTLCRSFARGNRLDVRAAGRPGFRARDVRCTRPLAAPASIEQNRRWAALVNSPNQQWIPKSGDASASSEADHHAP
jgi:hypothetical protein